MQKESILYGIIGLLIGIVLTIVVAANAVNNNMYDMMRMMGMHTQQNMMKSQEDMMHKDGTGMSMDDMVTGLKGKTGDDFDKAFLSEMIVHHQGAVDMANLALQYAKHDEIKDLAKDIISAQNKEIADMQNWQKQWGY